MRRAREDSGTQAGVYGGGGEGSASKSISTLFCFFKPEFVLSVFYFVPSSRQQVVLP